MSTQKMASIDDLPNEILLKIFGQIPEKKVLTRTCKRWNALTADCLSLKIDLRRTGNLEKFSDMEFTRRYQKLSIMGVALMCTDCSRCDALLHRSEKRPRLEVDNFKIIRKCLALIRQLEGSVKKLTLAFGSVEDKCLMAFLPRCSAESPLEILSISFCNVYLQNPHPAWLLDRIEATVEEGLDEISKMPKLKELHYEDRRITGDRAVRRKFFDTIVRKAPSVAYIALKCPNYACFPDFRIVRSFTLQLQQLCCVIWPIFAKDFFQLTLPNLKKLLLNFENCETVPDVTKFFESARSLTNLEVIDVLHMEVFQLGVYRCINLEQLGIVGGFPMEMSGLQNLQKLKKLSLYAWMDSELQHDAPCSQTLEKLVVGRGTVGPSFYNALVNSAPRLTALHITGDEMLNDECLQIICTTMPNLRRLELMLMVDVSEPVTDYGFRSVEMLCKLEYLYLETSEGGIFGVPPNYKYLRFSSWVQRLATSEIHLKQFFKFDLHNLLNFLLIPNLKTLTLEECGKGHRLADGLRMLRQLIGDSRPLPHIKFVSGE